MRKHRSFFGATVLFSAVVLGLPPAEALAFQGRGQAHGKAEKRQKAEKAGLAKRESLPPGLRRQLRERGTLPPGLQKRLVLVPRPLGTRLPAVPSYYQRHFAGADLIVVDTRTNRIAAVTRDVWR